MRDNHVTAEWAILRCRDHYIPENNELALCILHLALVNQLFILVSNQFVLVMVEWRIKEHLCSQHTRQFWERSPFLLKGGKRGIQYSGFWLVFKTFYWQNTVFINTYAQKFIIVKEVFCTNKVIIYPVGKQKCLNFLWTLLHQRTAKVLLQKLLC